MILYRCLPWDGSLSRAIGVLSFPRELQGGGRHDAPERYGCLYASEEPLSAVVEELGRFAGTELAAADLRRSRMPLALATLRLAGAALLVDLDDPRVLAAEGLRPSLLATADRTRTQAVAGALYERHAEVAGLRWWSTFDPRWKNVTEGGVFPRLAHRGVTSPRSPCPRREGLSASRGHGRAPT